MTYAIVPATREHIEALAKTMRQCDVDELAAVGVEPLKALEVSLGGSADSWVALVDDRPILACGLALGNNYGVPWMLASDEIKQHGAWFLRKCRAQRFASAVTLPPFRSSYW